MSTEVMNYTARLGGWGFLGVYALIVSDTVLGSTVCGRPAWTPPQTPDPISAAGSGPLALRREVERLQMAAGTWLRLAGNQRTSKLGRRAPGPRLCPELGGPEAPRQETART